jgi:hypothetical protein
LKRQNYLLYLYKNYVSANITIGKSYVITHCTCLSTNPEDMVAVAAFGLGLYTPAVDMISGAALANLPRNMGATRIFHNFMTALARFVKRRGIQLLSHSPYSLFASRTVHILYLSLAKSIFSICLSHSPYSLFASRLVHILYLPLAQFIFSICLSHSPYSLFASRTVHILYLPLAQSIFSICLSHSPYSLFASRTAHILYLPPLFIIYSSFIL